MQRTQIGYSAILILTLGITANAGVINGSFETPVLPSGTSSTDPTGTGIGWTFTGSSGITSNGSSMFSTPTPFGSQAAFLMAGTTPGSFSELVTGLSVGNTYNVSFSTAGSPGAGADPVFVSFGGVALGSYYNATNTWVPFTTTGTAATSSSMTLTFTLGPDPANYDELVDNVGISSLTTAPEPATFLLVAPLAGLLFWKRRRSVSV